METTVTVIGVYPIEAGEPVHLIELLVRNSKSAVDFGQITQELPGQPESDWQVPYDEKILDASGEKIVADPFITRKKLELWQGDVRLAFFFHYLDPSKPLRTPFGSVELPPISEKPSRLSEIQYQAP